MDLKSVLTILLFSVFINVQSQNFVQIQGLVIDDRTGISLPAAHIVIKKKQIASITNNDGQFNITLDLSQINDTIVVSFLGYESFIGDLPSYLMREEGPIRLIPQDFALKEVVVSGERLNLEKFMKTTAKSYYNNKRNDPHIAKGFYREKATNNNQYVMFNESIGYSVYFGKKTDEYSFFCENTRRSDSKENWRKYSLTLPNGEILSDVLSSSNLTLEQFKKIDNYGPISPKYYKSYSYRLDSTYYYNNQKLLSISFNKDSQSGCVKVFAHNFQVKSIEYHSTTINSRPLKKKINGKVSLEFIYIDNVPYIYSIKIFYSKENLKYWNEYCLLVQKFDQFSLNHEEIWALKYYEYLPFVDYHPKNWELSKIPLDLDYSEIEYQLKTVSKTLEEQFSTNSGRWWIDDFKKINPNSDPIELRKSMSEAKTIIVKLKIFF